MTWLLRRTMLTKQRRNHCKNKSLRLCCLSIDDFDSLWRLSTNKARDLLLPLPLRTYYGACRYHNYPRFNERNSRIQEESVVLLGPLPPMGDACCCSTSGKLLMIDNIEKQGGQYTLTLCLAMQQYRLCHNYELLLSSTISRLC